MRTLMLTLLIITASLVSGLAQIKVEIKEETKAMSKGSFNALTMELPGADPKEVEKNWKQFVKRYKGKTKYDRKVNEYYTDDAILAEMSDNTVDIIAKIETRSEGAQLIVWFNLGASYLSSKEFVDRYPAGERVLTRFADEISADLIAAELKEQEKMLKQKEDELKKLEKEKTKYEQNIKDAEATIKKMEENIVQANDGIKNNEGDQKAKTTEIEDQKKVVEEVQQRLDAVNSKK